MNSWQCWDSLWSRGFHSGCRRSRWSRPLEDPAQHSFTSVSKNPPHHCFDVSSPPADPFNARTRRATHRHAQARTQNLSDLRWPPNVARFGRASEESAQHARLFLNAGDETRVLLAKCRHGKSEQKFWSEPNSPLLTCRPPGCHCWPTAGGFVLRGGPTRSRWRF